MKSFFARTALAAAIVLCAGAAQAAVIDFENVDTDSALPPLISNGTHIAQGGYVVGVSDATGSTDPMAMVGSLIGGSSGGTCDGGIVCPGGDDSTYLAVLNTGQVQVQGPGTLTLQQFDAGFIAPAGGVPSGAFGLLVVEADRADNSYALGAFALNGPNSSGSTSFSTYLASDATYGLFSGSTGTINSGDVTDLWFLEFYCSTGSLGSCTLDRSNLGQFALDNISLAPVPESPSWALMALGLAGVGAAARRRRSA